MELLCKVEYVLGVTLWIVKHQGFINLEFLFISQHQSAIALITLLSKLPQKSMAVGSEHLFPCSWASSSGLPRGWCGPGSGGWLCFTLWLGWDWLYSDYPGQAFPWLMQEAQKPKPNQFSAHFTSTDIPLAKMDCLAKPHISGWGSVPCPQWAGTTQLIGEECRCTSLLFWGVETWGW